MTPKQRRGAVSLLGLLLLGTALETLGIRLVIPVMAFMSQGNPLERHSGSPTAFPWLQQLTHSELLSLAMLFLAATYALKAVYLGLAAWRQARFVFGVQVSLSRKLFEGHPRQPYAFHLQRNSAEMMRNVVHEASQFSHVVTIPAPTLTSEGLVLIGICSLLLVIEPLGAFVAVPLIAGAGLAFHNMTGQRAARWGMERQYQEGRRIHRRRAGTAGQENHSHGRAPHFDGGALRSRGAARARRSRGGR